MLSGYKIKPGIAMGETKSCLIVGAGIAGLTAADVLRQSGWEVMLLDKGRSAGGRMATRRLGKSRFDHGAQFFTVRDSRFQAAVERWEARGWAKPWFTEGGHVRYRGVEGMNGIVKELAKPFDLRTQTTVERVEPAEKGWRIMTDTGQEFSAGTLLLTPPAPQSMALLARCVDCLPADIVSSMNSIAYNPCFALLATLGGPSQVPSPGCVKLDSRPIAFVADNTQKGISFGSAALTIHAQADFTRSHLEAPQDEVAQLLLDAAKPWLGSQLLTWQLHRWRYSQPVATTAEPYLFTLEPAPLALAGDAFGGPRIEGAFLSGLAVAKRIIVGR